ncbi:ZFP2 protein, partial [Todus mexicanus]|nr:ZFP2 protein [Todus mexicanus]
STGDKATDMSNSAECGKSFRQSSNPSTCNVANPYVCAKCGKSFRQNSSLAQHRRVHTGEKLYVCADRGKSF